MAVKQYIGGISGLDRRVSDVIYGIVPDPQNLKGAFWSAFVHKLFTRIYEAFIAKSHGGPDNLGYSWKELSPKTRAYRNSEREPRPTGDSGFGLLTTKQLQTWKAIYASQLARLEKKGVNPRVASQKAAKTAWNILKAKFNAQTVIGVYANRKVLMLRVTEHLMQSLAPGILLGSSYLAPPNQIYVQSGTSVTIGTSVPYAPHQDLVRNLLPPAMSTWYMEAISAGIKNFWSVKRASRTN